MACVPEFPPVPIRGSLDAALFVLYDRRIRPALGLQHDSTARFGRIRPAPREHYLDDWGRIPGEPAGRTAGRLPHGVAAGSIRALVAVPPEWRGPRPGRVLPSLPVRKRPPIQSGDVG